MSIASPLLLSCLLLAVAARAAEPPSATPTTNGLRVVCQGGAEYSDGKLVFRDQVRVQEIDPPLYLECDLLTLHRSTNAARPKPAAPEGAPAAARPSLGPSADDGRVEQIVAEGKVFIITPEAQILGDKAVYTATNDLLSVTGELVILANAQGVGIGTQIIFDRKHNTVRGIGPFVFESSPNVSFGRGTNAPSPRPAADPGVIPNAPPLPRSPAPPRRAVSPRLQK